MWPFTWLKNKIANRSIEDIINSELKKRKIAKDQKILSKFTGTKSALLGYAMYQKFTENLCFEPDQELIDDIRVFIEKYHDFVSTKKDSIPQDDFLRFACMSYHTWQKIVDLKCRLSKENEVEEENARRPYEEPPGKYLKIKWKLEETELTRQIKKRITPDMPLKSIGISFPEIILIENDLRKLGYMIYLPSVELDKCTNKNVGYFILKCYNNTWKR
ncbi:MAG: hypothetical protein QW666_02825 [Candidatus Woesearchaeota archaeon]